MTYPYRSGCSECCPIVRTIIHTGQAAHVNSLALFIPRCLRHVATTRKDCPCHIIRSKTTSEFDSDWGVQEWEIPAAGCCATPGPRAYRNGSSLALTRFEERSTYGILFIPCGIGPGAQIPAWVLPPVPTYYYTLLAGTRFSLQ
jgi:hypothetical protein